MHIILVGGGEFGYELAKELHLTYDVTVIDIDDKVADKFANLDINFVLGNGATVHTLNAAKITESNILIASTASDEINILSCWTAKHLANIETICFVNHQGYIETFQGKDNKLLTNSHFKLDQIIWPKKALADELEKIISVPAAIDVEIFAQGKIKLFEYRIKNNIPIANKLIKNCFFPEDCIIVAIIRDEDVIIPDGNTQLLPLDKAIFIGTDESLDELSTNFFNTKHVIKSVIIVGGGTVGNILARNLEKKNLDVKIIEKSQERCEFLSSKLTRTLVLKGDGTDLELLQEEQIDKADVVVSVTNSDEKNLLCSLLAKQLGAKKVLTRVDKSSNLKLFETVGIDVALSPRSSAVKEIFNNVLIKNIDVLAIVELGKGEVLEITTPKFFPDTMIRDLNFPFKSVIGALIRKNKAIVPKGNTLIRAEDKLIIFTTPKDSGLVKKFFENIGL